MIFRALLILVLLTNLVQANAQADRKFFDGIKLFNQHQYQKALVLFNEVNDSVPGITVQYYIASAYFHLEESDTAEVLFESIVNKYRTEPEVGWAWVDLGSCYRANGRDEKAIDAFRTAGEQFPESNGWYHLGMLYASLKQPAQAFEAYSKQLSIDSLNPRFYAKRMEVDFELKKYDYALLDIQKAKELDPNYDIPMNEAFCYTMLDRYREADSIYATMENKSDPYYLNNCGFNKFKLGEIEQGKKLILTSLEKYPHNSFAYRNLAIIALHQELFIEACENLNKARQLNFERHFGSEVNELIEKYCSNE